MADDDWEIPEGGFQGDKELGSSIALQQLLQETKETVDRLSEELKEKTAQEQKLKDQILTFESVVGEHRKSKQRVEDFQEVQNDLKANIELLSETKKRLQNEVKQWEQEFEKKQHLTEENRQAQEEVERSISTQKEELKKLTERKNHAQTAILDLERKEKRKEKQLARSKQWFWLSVVLALLTVLGGSYMGQLYTQDLKEQLADCQSAITALVAERAKIPAVMVVSTEPVGA